MITLFYQTNIKVPNSIPYHLRDSEEYNYKSVKPTFIEEYCSYLKIPIRKVAKETWNGEKAFYHIEIDWIDAATIWQNVFTWIDTDVLSELQSKRSKLNLLLWFANEGFDLSMPRFIDIIDYCLKELQIPKEKVYFVFGDLNIKENYRSYVKKGFTDFNVAGLNSFEVSYNKECELLKKNNFKHTFVTEKQRKKNLHKNREKLFIFKNANPREHRLYFAGELKRRKLLKHAYFSWLNRYFTPPIGNKKDLISRYSADTSIYQDLENCINEFIKNSPYLIDFDKNSIEENLNQRILVPEHFLNSYFSFVTETTYDNNSSNVLFITEKVYQPIVQYHPFLVAGCPGLLEYLKSKDYATFPELFDESYDNEQDLIKRTSLIIKNIQNIAKMDKKRLNDIYYSETFQDKLIHNRNNFFTMNTKKDWVSILEWLQK